MKGRVYVVFLYFRGQPSIRENETQKRTAIRWARSCARYEWISRRSERPRRVSVFARDVDGASTLLYQCHYSAKLRRVVVEEL